MGIFNLTLPSLLSWGKSDFVNVAKNSIPPLHLLRSIRSSFEPILYPQTHIKAQSMGDYLVHCVRKSDIQTFAEKYIKTSIFFPVEAVKQNLITQDQMNESKELFREDLIQKLTIIFDAIRDYNKQNQASVQLIAKISEKSRLIPGSNSLHRYASFGGLSSIEGAVVLVELDAAGVLSTEAFKSRFLETIRKGNREVTFIAAHELQHITHNHMSKRLYSRFAYTALCSLPFVISCCSTQTLATRVFNALAGTYLMRSITSIFDYCVNKEQEKQADFGAVKELNSNAEAIETFTSLLNAYGNYPVICPNHPHPSDRLEYIRNWKPNQP